MALIWRGPYQQREASRDGRTLVVSLHSDGTWRLVVWKRPGSSAIVGVFHDAQIALLVAEEIPLDDASLEKLQATAKAVLEFAEALPTSADEAAQAMDNGRNTGGR